MKSYLVVQFKMYAITQRDTSLPVENLDFFEENTGSIMKNVELLIQSFRTAFCFLSGCGKTNTLLSLLLN